MQNTIKTRSISHVARDPLNETETVLACCTIAREKLEVGDYDGGCAVLAPWWHVGEWPNQAGLDQLVAGELLAHLISNMPLVDRRVVCS